MARDKKCPQCAELVKSEAHICRFCNYEFPPNILKPQGIKLRWKILLGLFGIGVISSLIGGQDGQKQNLKNDTKIESPSERHDRITANLEIEGEDQIKSMLKDPSSAEFRDTMGRISHGERVACGEVNSKNSFGALAGYTKWLVRFDKNKAYIEDTMNNASFAPMWNKLCYGKEDAIDQDSSPVHVASRTIKEADHACGHVADAKYTKDGSIHATCSNGETYRIIDLGQKYVAMKCSAAKKFGINGC